MIRALASSVGAGNSIFLSRRPDRRRAGSKMSTRFVAAITLMSEVDEKPSSCNQKITDRLLITRIMVSKGMVSKSKYSISEKNKGMPVSICPYF